MNVGCIPSKALLHSTHLLEHAKKDFAHHGITVSGIQYDLRRMMNNKNKVVKGLTGGIEMLFKKNKVCLCAVSLSLNAHLPHFSSLSLSRLPTSKASASFLVLTLSAWT